MSAAQETWVRAPEGIDGAESSGRCAFCGHADKCVEGEAWMTDFYVEIESGEVACPACALRVGGTE